MNKIHIFTYIFLLALLVTGCKDEEYAPINHFSDVAWLNSGDKQKDNGNEFNIPIGKYHSFSDLSQGALEHSWSFPGGSDINWLDGRITREDTDYTQFIVESKDTLSRENTIHLLFNKQGSYPIRLYNEFKDSVSFNGGSIENPIGYSSYYNKEKDVYVVDTSFVVRVYGDICPAVEVWHIKESGEEVLILDLSSDTIVDEEDMESWDTYTIEGGDSIKYVDKTLEYGEGWPTKTDWILEGVYPTEIIGKTIAIQKYNSPGIYTSQIRLKRESSTNQFPGTDKLSYLPFKLEVTPSTKPFGVSGQITELEDESIQIELTSDASEFSGEEGNFIVTVNNQVLDSPITIPVKSVKRNDHTKTNILLKLEDPIYNSDEITIQYLGGNITSTDGRELGEFTESVKMNMDYLTADKNVWGFESGGPYLPKEESSDTQWRASWNLDNKGTGTYTTDRAYSGNYSMKLTTGEGYKEWAIMDSPEILGMKQGKTYNIVYKYFRESDDNFHHIQAFMNPGNFSIPGSWHNNLNIIGEWTEWNYFKEKGMAFTFTAASANCFLTWRVANPANSGAGPLGSASIYFDDFEIYEWEPRPNP